jgi:hypothetical protein
MWQHLGRCEIHQIDITRDLLLHKWIKFASPVILPDPWTHNVITALGPIRLALRTRIMLELYSVV